MIMITNGQMTLTVPNSAFQSLYKDSGFHPLEDEEHVVAPADTFPAFEDETPEEDILDEETEDLEDSEEYEDESEDEEQVDLSEIPLSEMDFYQLSDYADQLGLDHRGIRSKKELRALIKNNI